MAIAPRHLSPTRLALAMLALAALPACHHGPPASDANDAAAEPSTIEFKNESLTQADVYVSSSNVGARRIGTVFSGRTDTLTIPRELVLRGTVSVVARLLARSRTPSTGPIGISPGAHLSIRLPLDEKTLVVLPAS